MEDKTNNIDEKLLLEDDRIVRFLKGKMATDEEHEFIQELESNEELKSKAIATARLVKGMKEVGSARDEDVTDEFMSADEEVIKSIAMNKGQTDSSYAASIRADRAKLWRRPVAWLSAAASVALLIWGGFTYNDYRQTTGLGNEYSTVFSSSRLIRGGDENAKTENKLAKLFDNVVTKTDLNNTLSELEEYWDLATQETYNDYTDYAAEIGWNLAVGHLRNNDKKKAIDVLIKLIDISPEGTAIGDKARELLKKVEEL